MNARPGGRSHWWWAGLVAGAVLLVALLLQLRAGGAPAPRAADSPIVDAALADYRRTLAGELPGSAGDLATVRAGLAFPVRLLGAPDAHLVSAWSTTLRGEPAAALAYRWGGGVVVQYVVSERLFFRQPDVRRAVAARRVFAAVHGAQGVLAWAEPASGALLVGDASPAELARARGGTVTF